MEITFKSLAESSESEITNVFNEAFADYVIKIQITEKNLADKILTENILLEKSVGAFLGTKLVGFILIGIDDFAGKLFAYNGGTGVIPSFRGHKLTIKMYEYIFKSLRTETIHFHQLEVNTTNLNAFKIYEKIGFRQVRVLCCFKGKGTNDKKKRG